VSHQRPAFAEVGLPFIIFTAIWGSTWIVIRDQLGTVPAQWSVAYRFVIAATAMALVARLKGEDLRLGRGAILPALFLGFAQFCVNFNAVYLAERHITSGVVATIFALLLIPSTLMAWAFLGHRPSGRFVLVGIPSERVFTVDIHTAMGKELEIQTVKRSNNRGHEAIELLASGKIPDTLITHRMELAHTAEGFEMVSGYKDGVGKLVVEIDW